MDSFQGIDSFEVDREGVVYNILKATSPAELIEELETSAKHIQKVYKA